MKILNFLAVGLGGALGASARYALGLIPIKTDFPFITLIINLFGALIIGFISGVSESTGLNGKLVLFLKTGVCGGFTTFSTFSLETWKLLEGGKHFMAAGYALLSVALCVIGVIIGEYLAKRLVKA